MPDGLWVLLVFNVIVRTSGGLLYILSDGSIENTKQYLRIKKEIDAYEYNHTAITICYMLIKVSSKHHFKCVRHFIYGINERNEKV
jgi:hypothetical protein